MGGTWTRWWGRTRSRYSSRRSSNTCRSIPPGRAMRASTARLMNSPVRLADLTFPQVNRLIHRTRLAFVHLDNLLAFAKRDRDGRVDGYITAYLPEECLLVFFRKGEAMNAASLHTGGGEAAPITQALKTIAATGG